MHVPSKLTVASLLPFSSDQEPPDTYPWWPISVRRRSPDWTSINPTSPKLSAVAMVRPSGEKFIHPQNLYIRMDPETVLIFSPLVTSHRVIVRPDTLASVRGLVGENCTLPDNSVRIVRSGAPVVVSHTQIDACDGSSPPLASRAPSAVNEREHTHPKGNHRSGSACRGRTHSEGRPGGQRRAAERC